MSRLAMFAALVGASCSAPAPPGVTCDEYCTRRVACGPAEPVASCIALCRDERNVHHALCQSAFEQFKACELAHLAPCPDGGLNRNGACSIARCRLYSCDDCSGCSVTCDDHKCYPPGIPSGVFCD